MKSLTRKILLTVSVIVLAAALAVGLVLAFTGNGTTFAASASGFDVGDNNYSSFGNAWSAAESGSSADSPQTIVLNENVALTSSYKVEADENVILDLNGHNLSIKTPGKFVDVYGTFTLTDSTAEAPVKYTGSHKVGVYSSSSGFMTVYEADDGSGTDTLCKYSYTSGAIYGADTSDNSMGAVMVYNGGVFNMDGGTLAYSTYTPSNINDALTAVVYVDESSTFCMTGGSISGNTTTDTVTIYLAGEGYIYGGVVSGNTSDQTGTVYAESALTVGDKDDKSGPVISGNTARCGGGISALANVNMYGGEICCNTTTGSGRLGSGAGVYIMGGDFTMYGGSIHDNNVTSTTYGGGAIFAYGNSSTRYVVDISGGDIYGNYAVENGGGILSYYCDVYLREGAKIRKNESRFGAGVYTANTSSYATFTMYGGEVSDNKANQSGGASYCYGTTTIYDGLVSGNTAVTGGGAFHVRTQPFAIYGGTFSANSTSGTSNSTGGGVICTADSSSSVTVTGGVFTDNYSAGYGGAMSFYIGSASISGVTITDNSAGKYAGGIYVRSNAAVSFSGDVCVRSNYVGETRENVFLDSNATVTLSGALGSSSYVGVYISGSGQTQVTKAESGSSYYLEALRYFHSDVLFDGRYLGYGDSYIELKSGSDVVARVDSPSSATSSFYTSFSDALDAAEATSASGAGTAVLLKTFTLPSYSGDAWYEVGASYYLTLDLNGYDMVLDSERIRAFAVSGNLTLTDSWEEYKYLGTSGTLGATKFSSLGSFETVYRYTDTETGEVGYWRYISGAIYGANFSSDDEAHNGVVKVSEGGTFNMLGGTLTGNRSFQGSGVSVYGGTFKMYGGAISYNTGVSVYATGGDVMICGGVITGTSSGYYGSAMRITGSTLYVYESDDALAPIVVSENSDGDYGVVYIQNGSYAYIEAGNFEFNSAKDGGVLYVRDGSEAVIAGGLFSNNTATNSGSAVYVNTATLSMTGGVISGNTANGGGSTYSAAVFVRYGTFYMSGGEIFGNVSTSSNSYGGGVNVSQSTFEMSGGSIYGNTSTYGAGVYVYNGINTDSIFTMTGGSIYGNTASNGAGVFVDNSSSFEMSGGEIYGNEATGNGFSGVYVNAATFTMTGGEIYGNHGIWGGGVGVYYSSKFVMAEGSTEETSPSIHDNVGEQYGGGVTVSESTFEMSCGEIFGNTSEDDAGVCVMFTTAKFTMTGGKIHDNTATASYGGGVTVGSGATFDMYGGEIYSNTAATYGGGVAVLGSNTFNMYGGEIYSNTAATYGGGISTNSGSYLTIAGGSIYENSAQNGAGIYIAGTATLSTDLDDENIVDSENVVNIYENSATVRGGGVYGAHNFTMSGVIVIKDNTSPSGKDNLYLSSSSVYITLGGDMETGSYIGLSLYSSTKTQITTAETSSEHYINSAKYFHLDDDNLAYTYYVGYKNGNYVEVLSLEAGSAMVEHSDGSMEVSSSAEEALQNAVSGDTVILYDDVVWSDCDFGSNVWYEIASGVELTIDLNGHNIELDSDAYRAFRVYGTLNLTDSSGVYEKYSGTLEPGVYQNDDGTFTTIYRMTDEETLETSAYSYTSGAIYGGTNTTNSTQYYGAIYVGEKGSLNIYGGTITGNTRCYGGGVYVRGGNSAATGAYFAMYGGSVSGNTTTRHASALYFGYNTDAYIYGGIVSSNTVTATQYGGAIYTYSGVNLYIYEDTDVPTVFSHNSAYYGGGLALNTNTCCEVHGGHFEFNDVTNGGAIYTWSSAVLDVFGGLFANSTASAHGGAFYVRGEFNMYGGTVQGNVSTSSTYGAGAVLIYNADGTAVFNMYGGTITNNTSRSHYGGGVAVDYGGIFNMYGGEISKNSAATDGGGIYITSRGGEVHLYGGEVSENDADYGGGVYIASGTLYVEGGTIDGNSATYGGGVYSCGDVYIYDGGVVNNSTTGYYGGGIYMSAGTTLVIEDGFVCNNTASRYGGGIYSFGDVYMNGGYVSKNTASDDGGGIYVRENASMTMTGGHITENASNGTSWGGGGILVNYNASFVMTGGEIASNKAVSYGAGVYLGHGSSFTITGGEIRENSAGKGAAGVFTQTCTCHDICVVEVGGKAVIRDNVLTSEIGSNVVLIEGQYINLVSDLERGSYVGFTLSSGTQVTSAESGTSYYLDSYSYFHPDDDTLTVGYSSTGRYVETIDATGAAVAVRYTDGTTYTYTSYKEALDAAKADTESGAGTAVLLRDIYYEEDCRQTSGYGLGSAYYLSLDLNGHSIHLSSAYSRAFDVMGSFSLYDSTGYYSEYSGNLTEGVYDNGDGTFTTIYKKSDTDTCETKLYSYTSGAITGDGSEGTSRYGAIYVEGGGTLSIYGGTICGNTHNYGSGIYILGAYNTSGRDTVFNMYGGSVSGNTATDQGGGIVATYCYVNIYGGIISGNTASSTAGGLAILSDKSVYIGTPTDAATAALCDVAPVISGNEAGTYGGGLHINCASDVTLCGANIEYNTSGSGGAGIYFSNSGTSTFSDAFIGYNTSAATGGGIYVVSGDITFSSGKIYFNTAESAGYGGAGVYVSSGASFSLTGGIVSQNVTAGYGGGVYLESGSELLVSNAEISFNTAASMGGGVYALGTLSVSGEAVIRDNTAKGLEENVLLSKDNYIVLAGTLSGDAYIGVSFADSSQTQITSEESTTTRYRSAYRYFFLDVDADDYFVYYSASRYVVIIPSGEIFVIVKDAEGGETYYASIEDAWAAAISSDPDGVNTIILNADVSPDETLTVESGEYLALDFNGHAINAPSPDSAIEASGTLYLYDSTEVYAFDIEYEGNAAVVDNGDGTFTTYYATVADMDTGEKQWNSYTSGGITGHSDGVSVGAIHVVGAGVLNMYGGSVVLNEAGPGIYMTSGGGSPSLYMYGGSVSGNSNTAGGAAAIGASNGYMYIYGGIIAANVTEGENGEIISADGTSSLYLGTDDEGILSYLVEINPDAYEAGVVISGNYVGKDGYDRLIYMSFSAKTFAMYDRVEISYNCQDASNRGFIQISAGTGYFYGGTIAWNTTGETYGVIQYVSRAYFYGDFFLGHNSTREDAEGEEHGNLYGSSFRVDDSFTGVIYVSETTSDSLRVTWGTVSEDIYSHVISDRGYCRGIDTYLYFYYEHTDPQTILAYEDGVFVVYKVCLGCGDILQRLVVGGDDNDYEVKFRIGENGVEAYIEDPDNSDEELCSVAMDGGYLVTSVTGDDATYTWYEDINDAIAGLSDGDKLTLYEDTNLSGSEITVNAAGVTVDLGGNSLIGDVNLSGSGSTLEVNGGNVIGSVTVSGDVDLGGGNISGNLTVSGDNSSVDFDGGTVSGDVSVSGANSSLDIDGGYVGGSVDVSGSGVKVDLDGGTVEGDVSVSGEGSSIDINEGNVGGDVSVSGSGAEVDLNGGTVEGGLNVSGENTSATVKDSSEDDSGYVGGDIDVEDDSSLSITGGNFADAENAENYFDLTTGEGEPEKVIYVAEGGTSYGVVSAGDINSEGGKGKIAAASVTVEKDGGSVTYYFESFADAVNFLGENGGKITLESDAECAETIEIDTAIEIDLNGHTLTADFYIDAGEGYDESDPVSLTVGDDSSGDGKGSLVGTITVAGYNSKDTEGDSSYKNTLSISTEVFDGINVDLTGLTGDGVIYGLTSDGTENVYYITTGHTHSYTNLEFSYNADGTVTYIKKCACGETEKDAGGDEVTYAGNIVGYAYDGMIGQSVSLFVSGSGSADVYDDILVIEPVAMVRYTVENVTITMFFESFEAAAAYAESVLTEEAAESATVVLMKNTSDVDLEVSSGNLTINLNGYSLSGNVTVAEGATVTVANSTGVTVDNYLTQGSDTIKYGNSGLIDVNVTCDEDSAFEITAGYIAEENLEKLEGYIAKDFVAIYENGRYAVMEEAEAKDRAVAYIVDSDGNVTYYLTLQDAVDEAGDGDTIYITANAASSGEESVGLYGKDVTIDLNGYTLAADIEVDSTSSVTFRDTSASGVGLLSGEITGSGDITVESGSYATDVSEYLAANKTLYAVYDECTKANTYTVINKYGSTEAAEAAASVTRTDGEGNTYTIYYDSIVGAMADLRDGDTLTLLGDITGKDDFVLSFTSSDGTSVDVTLDLNGYTADCGIEVGSGVELTIVDSSAGITGGVSGSYDSGEGSVTGTVKVDGNGSLSVEGGTYSQDISGYVEGEYAVVATDENGETQYTVMSEKEAQKEAGASVTYKDAEGGEHTVYFEDAYSAIEWADGLSSDANSGAENVTVTLYEDVEIPSGSGKTGLEISGDVTIELNDNDIKCDIEVESGGSLTITGEGNVTGTVSGGAGTFVADGGTYTQDVSGYVSDGGKTILVSTTTDESGETVTSYEVLDEADAQSKAAASVTVVTTDSDGKYVYTTTYYEDIEDALEAVEEASGNASKGVGYTLTLWDDVETEGDDSLTLDGNFTLDMNGFDVDADIEIAAGSDIEIDLDGGTVNGDITVGGEDESGSSSLSMTDSSEDGSGSVTGEVSKGNTSSEITADGGTYGGYEGEVAEDFETMVGADDSVVIVPADSVDELAGAYVAEYDGDGIETGRTYYESAEDAIKAAAENGGTVVLLDDACITDLTITGDLVIDLNGNSLYIEATIEADATTSSGGDTTTEAGAGGSLKITDGSAYDDEGNLTGGGGSGTVSGSITVEGSQNASDAASGETNPYENTLVFEGGAVPGDNLDITLKIGSNTEGGAAYVFGETVDVNGEPTGSYGIYVDASHEHSYDIEVWTRNEDGSVTLTFRCSCGDGDEERSYTIKAEDLEVTDVNEEDGTYTVSGTYTVTDEYGTETTYTYTDKRTLAATVTDGDDTYYFDSLQDAVDFVTESGSEDLVITLQTDTGEDIEIEEGKATIDLNGHDLNGSTTVDRGASLTITDSSADEDEGAADTGSVNGDMKVSGGELNLEGGTYNGDIEVTEGGSLNVTDGADVNSNITVSGDESKFTAEGGTYAYTEENLAAITDALENTDDGRYAYVTDEGTIVVTDDSSVAENARVKIVRGGVEIYYDSLGEACAALADGDTLVLLGGVASDKSVDISGAIGVTIDLNDNEILGSVNVSLGAGVTITGTGYVESLSVDDDSDSDLSLQGGTYNDWNYVTEYTDAGCVILVNDGYTYTVTTAAEAEKTAEARTSSHEGDGSYRGDIYFENLQDAVDYALSVGEEESGESTTPEVTLVSDTEDGVSVSGDLVIDLAGNDLGGDVVVSGGKEFTLEDSSKDGSGTVSGQIYAGTGSEGDETTVNVNGGTVEKGVYGGDYTEVNVAGGTVDGNIETGDNSTVNVTESDDGDGSKVGGNISTGANSEVSVSGSDVEGDITTGRGVGDDETDESGITVEGDSRVGGDISTGGDSEVTVSDSTVGGGISTGDESEVSVSGSEIGKNITTGDDSSVEVKDNEAGEGSRVGGNIETGTNSEVTVSGSDVEGGISTGNGAEEGKTDGSSVTVDGGSYVGGGISTGDGSSGEEVGEDADRSSVEVTDSTVDGGITTGDDSDVTVSGSFVDGDIETGTNSDVTVTGSDVEGGISTGNGAEEGDTDGSGVTVENGSHVGGKITTGDGPSAGGGDKGGEDDRSSVNVSDSSVDGGISTGDNYDVTVSGSDIGVPSSDGENDDESEGESGEEPGEESGEETETGEKSGITTGDNSSVTVKENDDGEGSRVGGDISTGASSDVKVSGSDVEGEISTGNGVEDGGTDGSSVTVENGATVGDGITTGSGSKVDISDDNAEGTTVDGGVSTGTNSEFEVSGGTVNGDVELGDETESSVTGGNFEDKEFVESLNGVIGVVTGDGNLAVMTEDEAKDFADAYVEVPLYSDDGEPVIDEDTGEQTTEKTYYENIEDAIAAAEDVDGAKVVLNHDVACDDTIDIYGYVEIDTNGYTLDADIVIHADGDTNGDGVVDDTEYGAGGSLTVSDSSTDGTGSFTGSIAVEGEGDVTSDGNPYEDTLTFTDGVTPGADLDVDMSNLGTGTDYVLEYDESTGEYSIVSGDEHTEHTFNIEVWEFDENGKMTLRFMCVCGEYETDKDGKEIVYTATISDEYVYDSATNTITYTYTVELDGSTYTTKVVYECQASVTVTDTETGETEQYYFEDLQDAIDYALENGGTVALESDFEGDLVIGDGADVGIDLSGHTFEGSITVPDDSSLTFTSEDGTGEVIISGGDVEGTLVLDGVDVTLTGDLDVSEGTLEIEGSVTMDLGESTLTAVPEISSGSSLILTGGEGSGLVLSGDMTLEDGASLTIGGCTDFNLGGNEIEVEKKDMSDETKGGTFTLTDNASVTFDGGTFEGDISVDDGADVTINVGSGTFAGDVAGGGSVTEYVSEGGSVTGDTSVSGDASVYVDGGSYTGDVTSESDVLVNITGGGTFTGNIEATGDENGCVEILVDGDNSVFEGDITSLGDAEITVNEGSTITSSGDGKGISIGGNADISVGGGTIESDVTVTGDAKISVTNGGVITTSDEDEDAEGITVGGGADISVSGGTIESDVSVEGDAKISVTNGGEISGDTSVGGDANVSMNGGTISGDMTFEVEADVYVGSGSLISGSMTFEGGSTLDLAGGTVSGENAEITVGEEGALAVTDSSRRNSGMIETPITVEAGGSLEMHDGTYSVEADKNGETATSPAVTVHEGTDEEGDTCYVFVSVAEDDGTVYYVVMTKEEHEKAGHGYDVVKKYEFDPETATLTITFTCLCGEDVEYEKVLSYGDGYTTSYEMTEDSDGKECALVTVEYRYVEYLEAPNGVIYTVNISDTCELEDYLYFGISDENFTMVNTQAATCYQGGEDTYTYGQSGIKVVVTSGASHSHIDVYRTLEDGTVIYYCTECGMYYIGSDTALYENGYTGDWLDTEIGNYEDFTDSKDEAMKALEELFDEYFADGDDEEGYGKQAKEALDEALKALEELEYEFLGDGSTVSGELSETVQGILDEAELAITNAALAENAESEIKNAYGDIIDSLKETGEWSEELEGAIKEELDAIISDLGHVKAASTSAEDLSVFDTFIESATRDLLSSFTTKSVSSSSASESGYEAGLTVTEGDGFSGTIELIIEDVYDEGYYAWLIANSTLTYYVDGQVSDTYTGEALEAMINGKGIVAVFDIYLKDSFSGVKVYVFSGTYVVSVTLPEDIANIENLLVVYVGDDGKAEVYDTYVENGVLYFTTTHFSEFVLLGDAETEYVVGGSGTSTGAGAAEEKETDLMPAIIALAVVDGVLLILGIVLLVILLMRKGKIGGKKGTAAVGIFALLSIVPAGGLAITIVLGVLALAFLAADIYLIYAVFTSVPVVEYVEGGDGTTVDTNGDVTLSTDEENEGEKRENE